MSEQRCGTRPSGHCPHPLLISAPAVRGPGINIHCRRCRRLIRANVPIWRGHELADRFNRTKRAKGEA